MKSEIFIKRIGLEINKVDAVTKLKDTLINFEINYMFFFLQRKFQRAIS